MGSSDSVKAPVRAKAFLPGTDAQLDNTSMQTRQNYVASTQVSDNPHVFQFGTEVPYTVPSHILQEANGTVTWNFPNFRKVSILRRLRSVISKEEAQEMLQLLPKQFSTIADSVDKLPSHEYYIENYADGGPFAGDALVNLSHSVIEMRLLPYIRQKYACPQCRSCVSLVRRYQAGERMSHPAHYDRQAFITAMISLTSSGTDFTGGLYVRSLPGTEQFVDTQAGEAIIHQSDLEHGVKVHKGVRYSWIIWFQDRSQCSSSPNPDWFIDSAIHVDPIAIYNLGAVLTEGEHEKQDYEERVGFKAFLQAAETGYARAQFKVGNAYYSGKGVDQNYTAAHYWYEKAAKQNLSIAAYNLARMYDNGFGTERDLIVAVKWYRRSMIDSFYRYSAALNNLAILLYNGEKGVERNETEAIELWKEAADDGMALAALNLAELYAAKAANWRARYEKLKAALPQV